ncbi:MICOS complex subunit MIC10 [Anastrepha obliqua]|uniref:MICOS complex subunit MIC10 n=1 Tax=Anastrepha ludens TaxID=28586 RepID=UPI0023B19675|nr:MICOS complex subunit MIC10 [Anastrepha ludens]XP_054725664.1 MICOS complex subunit MIC10 [Anastrepha obliqua]
MAAPKSNFSEDEFGRRLDRCLTDVVVKGSSGLVLGLTLSVLMFRRRAWPSIMGAGFGIGVAYKSCEKDLSL